MKIIDIENLSVEELKEQRAELVHSAMAADLGDLASRYIQARTDAKKRDVTLGEQGRTIATLNDSLDDARKHVGDLAATHAAQAEAAAARIREVEAERDASNVSLQNHAEESSKRQEQARVQLADLQGKLQAEVQRSGRLRVQAGKFTAAISTISKVSLDAINSQAIDEAGQ